MPSTAPKKKTCVAGVSCGNTCIARNRTCRKTLSHSQKQKAEALKKAAKESPKQGKIGPAPASWASKSQTERDGATQQAFDDLNFEYNYGGFMPINQLRQRMGLATKDFDDQLRSMQERDLFYLSDNSEDPKTSKEDIRGGLPGALGTKTHLRTAESAIQSKKKLQATLDDPTVFGKDKAINTQRKFDKALDRAFSELTNGDGRSPIYIKDLRQKMGDKVDRKDFTKWLYRSAKYTLTEGGERTMGDGGARDGVTTPVNGLRTFVRLNPR